MSDTDLCPSCGGDCGVGECESYPDTTIAPPGDLTSGDWDDKACEHEHDESCYDYQGFYSCTHAHYCVCGQCGCPGYCDDHQTYNLRPSETGGPLERDGIPTGEAVRLAAGGDPGE